MLTERDDVDVRDLSVDEPLQQSVRRRTTRTPFRGEELDDDRDRRCGLPSGNDAGEQDEQRSHTMSHSHILDPSTGSNDLDRASLKLKVAAPHRLCGRPTSLNWRVGGITF